MVRGRFAPTPSGPLHMGSLVTAVASFLDVRSRGGQWLLRIEDVDTTRSRSHFENDILHQLERHGLYWDEAPVRQSQRSQFYLNALHDLALSKRVYFCSCTRQSLLKSGCRENFEGELIYPGYCRQPEHFLDGDHLSRTAHAIRFVLPESSQYVFFDELQGVVSGHLKDDSGDFVLRRGDGCFAYHLAVVVDDYLQGINRVVRGADILSLTGRHIVLQEALGFSRPQYVHIPLVLSSEGVKLSKSKSAAALAETPALDNMVSALGHLGIELKANDFASVDDILSYAAGRFCASLGSKTRSRDE